LGIWVHAVHLCTEGTPVNLANDASLNVLIFYLNDP
jgi:hypothetical protein